MDDPERVGATVGALGNMALTALNELDRADLLQADSPIQDLGLVMAIFACWGKDMEDYAVDCDAFDGGVTSWVPKVVGYAARAKPPSGVTAKGCVKRRYAPPAAATAVPAAARAVSVRMTVRVAVAVSVSVTQSSAAAAPGTRRPA